MTRINRARSDALDVAVIGTGISGMAAAWLLSERHRVTVYEQEGRPGGHCRTELVETPGGTVPVDTGFIVYNERTYPNLTALFRHLEVPTKPSEMSFAVSLDDGAYEYCGSGVRGFFAQRGNLINPSHWRLLGELARFYREAQSANLPSETLTLGEFLAALGYSRDLAEHHLLPMAAAIWSAPIEKLRDYPAAAFLRFFSNHGLLELRGRPQWRAVMGGSREYVARLTARYADRIKLGVAAKAIHRNEGGVLIADRDGKVARFDQVVIATHADQALALIDDPSGEEEKLLGAFSYQPNLAVLHRDPALMPRRRRVWSSWNYLGRRNAQSETRLSVTYWMNRLQSIPDATPLFVTLNPAALPRRDSIITTTVYEHPVFDTRAIKAQKRLWSLQGRRSTWFCGAYFGAGFHEDGLQAGLAVAEALGGLRRPWRVENESGRIHLGPVPVPAPALEPAA